MNKRLLSVIEAANYLSISPRTIYNAIGPSAKVPFPVRPKRIGKLVRFDIRDLDRYVDSLDSASNDLVQQDMKPVDKSRDIEKRN